MASRKGAEHASNIMEALEDAGRPMSAYDLLDKLRPTGVTAPLTVYRALDKLIAAGKVHRIESLNAFVACSHDDHKHGAPQEHERQPQQVVAFIICDCCGQVDEFHDAELFGRLDGRLAARGFVPRSSALEVHGLCAGCAAAGAAEAEAAAS